MLLSLAFSLLSFLHIVACEHGCGHILSGIQRYAIEYFYASDVYNCWISVPFNETVARSFLDYYATTLLFQSTLAYLQAPPRDSNGTGYQQPSINVYRRLLQINDSIEAGNYTNQYVFEVDVQQMVQQMHDGHVDLTAGILSSFSFASSYDISAASVSGIDPPQLYLTDDIIDSQYEGWTPSPITLINGYNATEFTLKFAEKQAFGTVEPHADWNKLMSHPAQDIQGGFSTYSGAEFYPGRELNFTFANGTRIDTYWLARYDYSEEPPSGLVDSQDFYDFFVLGQALPSRDKKRRRSTTAPGMGEYILKALDPSPQTSSASAQSSSTSSSAAIRPTRHPGKDNSWYEPSGGAYPDPNIAQPDLSLLGGGILSGYFLDDVSAAVLSIPSFQQYGEYSELFAATVGQIIVNATATGLKKLVVDLQQNTGGDIVLALTTFKQLFPQIDPFGGSRRRSHRLASILGSSTTSWWSSLNETDQNHAYWKTLWAGKEWVMADRLNAETSHNFSNWAEYYGPRQYNYDNFSVVERYDLYNERFDRAFFGGYVPYGYGKHNPVITSPPWKPEDIILLTDGLCSSSCALFVEMMTQEAGVRTVVMGGNPKPGKMQAASGSRGAVVSDQSRLDDAFDFIAEINPRWEPLRAQRNGPPMSVLNAPINLRDQVRPNDTVPLQFKYLPANCRMYYTLRNVYNMSQLWRDVVHAAWHNSSLCVEGSLHPATPAQPYKILPSVAATDSQPSSTGAPFRDWLSAADDDDDDGITEEEAEDGVQQPKGLCKKKGSCPADKPGYACMSYPITCPHMKETTGWFCVKPCNSWVSGQCGGSACNPEAYPEVKCNGKSLCPASGKKKVKNHFIGHCRPSKAQAAAFCQQLAKDGGSLPENATEGSGSTQDGTSGGPYEDFPQSPS